MRGVRVGLRHRRLKESGYGCFRDTRVHLRPAALGFAIRNNERLNKLEKKLKEFDVIPREFDSEELEKEPPAQD